LYVITSGVWKAVRSWTSKCPSHVQKALEPMILLLSWLSVDGAISSYSIILGWMNLLGAAETHCWF
jgi:hypothetical protein